MFSSFWGPKQGTDDAKEGEQAVPVAVPVEDIKSDGKNSVASIPTDEKDDAPPVAMAVYQDVAAPKSTLPIENTSAQTNSNLSATTPTSKGVGYSRYLTNALVSSFIVAMFILNLV